MDTWWCAIHKKWTDYSELKQRGVVAQGWPGLGDLRTLSKLVPDSEDSFKQAIVALGDVAYRGEQDWDQQDRQLTRAPAVFWNLLSIRRGDVVVGAEGTTVRGVCQARSDARFIYCYDPRFHYAQSLGPVRWVDWDESRFGFLPTTPGQSVHGIKRLVEEKDAVVAAWKRAGEPVVPVSAYWVNVDIPTRKCTLHVETCAHVSRVAQTPFKGVRQLLRDGGWLEFGRDNDAVRYCQDLSEVRSGYQVSHCQDCAPTD